MVVAQWHGKNQLTIFFEQCEQVVERCQNLFWIAGILVPTNVLECRDSNDQGILFAWFIGDHVFVDNPGCLFILINHLMFKGKIVLEHVANFQNCFGIMLIVEVFCDRDFNGSLILSCVVVGVVEVGELCIFEKKVMAMEEVVFELFEKVEHGIILANRKYQSGGKR